MWQKSKNIYHLAKAILASSWFGHPARSMVVIGVTGTDGKTTTSSLIYHILKNAGKKVALISTVSAIIDDQIYDTGFHVSTPDSWILQSYIKKAKEAGCTHLVLEVTSHGLDQNRVFGIPFAVGVITNVSREHLDYHKTMENYLEAKAKLLYMANVAILNRDDASFEKLKVVGTHAKDKKVVTYGLNNNADITPQTFPFKTQLFGEFNLYNCLAAISACIEVGIDTQEIRQNIQSFTPPKGRMDVVYDKEFRIMIDFAHTPNAITHLLEALAKNKKGRLIHVFGSAGERDHGKRPLMGKASSLFADRIILTSEDPRFETVQSINEEIKKGMEKTDTVIEITDRLEAITHAIQEAQKNDTVVITGKGHESSMNSKGREVAWSDYEAVKKALATRGE